jgi:hypothetical protein
MQVNILGVAGRVVAGVAINRGKALAVRRGVISDVDDVALGGASGQQQAKSYGIHETHDAA